MVFSRYRRKHSHSLTVLCAVLVVFAVWLYKRRDYQEGSFEFEQGFEDYLAVHRQWQTTLDPPKPLLEIYGLVKREAVPEAWAAMKQMIKMKVNEESLMAPVYFESNGRFEYTNLEPLANHIQQTMANHQRFLTSSFVRLHSIVQRLPAIEERKLIERKLSTTLGKSREFSRVIRKELKDFKVRTGLAKKTREAMYKLKLKVQAAIERRQNYPCDKAILCNLTNPNGFASGIHDILYCLVKGLQSNSRVILDAGNWHYLSNDLRWEQFFRNLADTSGNKTCVNVTNTGLPGLNGAYRNDIHDLPVDIAEPLIRYHQDPYAWWFGQFIGYIMKPSTLTEELIAQAKQSLGFKSPIVGLHIRRTDKSSEAAYHDIEDYMEHAEEFYEDLAADVPKRVFVATDEPKVVADLRKSFPDFVFISNARSAELANDLDTRYLPESFQGVLIDLYLLAQSDKLVCTLSSGLCRVAYELMQARRTDASENIESLDVSYFYAFVATPPRKVLYGHKPIESREMTLSAEDCVARTSSEAVISESKKKERYDGFSSGILCGSNILAGVFPLFKTVPMVRINGTRLSLF